MKVGSRPGRPILFSGSMIRALLAGTKTQTRRIFKIKGPMGNRCEITSPAEEVLRFGDGSFHYLSTAAMSGPYPCPYGVPGDHLWVRETWRRLGDMPDSQCTGPEHAMYAATAREAELAIFKWKPSIHMPRWASRIDLKINELRAERVQDISAADSKAEGLSRVSGGTPYGIPGFPNSWSDDPRKSYRALWTSINGVGSWESNPWVWVLSFERVKP